ncbi:hypothetical protein D9758_003487 [Tetrapyrgos nigripes]|uniref:Cytochrome P450 n=1 Tax=Tetrapyrgos nigripes TaxID=182062 RepID=A0A8H5LW74_9AGAR|nr:hypothetical protein D9758_003487 [Tetrapyrgos nigripes]
MFPAFVVASLIIVILIRRVRYKSLGFLRGPPSPSFLLGNNYEIENQEDGTLVEDKWFKEYGTAFRYTGSLGLEMLMVADVKALQYILHTSGYRFPKSRDSRELALRFLGKGIIWAEGQVHQRQRKAMNPAFSASQLKQFLNLFQVSVDKANKWGQMLQDKKGGDTLDVAQWLPRATLDVIGESAFDFKFDALDNKSSELSDAMRHATDDSRDPSQLLILFRTWRRRLALPDFFLELIDSLPITKEDFRFEHFLKTSKKVGKELLESKGEDAAARDEKDILSVLVRSNRAEDIKKRMNEDEVLSQIATLILAGHETTAYTMCWILYELAMRPEQQEKIVGELAEIRLRNPAGYLTAQEYDSMPFFNAIIKEGLRLHPVVARLNRVAGQDDVIPLAESVKSTSGDYMSHIPVKKGQNITIDIFRYNRLTSVWGEDASEWNPSRFLNRDLKDQLSLGVYSNVVTFSGGVRACIGWRFAVMEMQALLAGILQEFEFAVPPSLDLVTCPTMNTAAGPMLRDQKDKGIHLPLVVRARAKPTV